jgi:hypothetical protein
MAQCDNFCLRTDGLTGADTGGTWALVSGSFSGSLATDNPCIDTTDLGFGLNVFSYTLPASGECPEVVSELKLYRANLGSGDETNAITICDNQDPVILVSLIGNFVGGTDATYTWENINSASGYSFNGFYTLSSFDPKVDGVGVYRFRLLATPNLPSGFLLEECCEPLKFDIEITVTEGFNAGTGGNFVVC